MLLPDEVAFFIGKRFRSNIRELEGALHRVVANAHFLGSPITLDFAKDALRDLLALQDRLITLDNIQKTVAEYYKIRVSDLLSKRRNRSIARPRQVAMALAKELTNHSLPEIGDFAIFLDDVVAVDILERELPMHDEVHRSYDCVLLVQLVALLDLYDLAFIKYHLESIE